jgi:hypothetical protein
MTGVAVETHTLNFAEISSRYNALETTFSILGNSFETIGRFSNELISKLFSKDRTDELTPRCVIINYKNPNG